MTKSLPRNYYESAEDRAEERAEKESYVRQPRTSPKPVRETWDQIFARIVSKMILGDVPNDMNISVTDPTPDNGENPQVARALTPLIPGQRTEPLEAL